MKREEALEILSSNISNKNLIKHMLAVEAIMGQVARKLEENEEEWKLVGLLHDIDFEKTKEMPEKHGLLAEEILNGKVSDEILRAIKSHNFENTKVLPLSKMENALIASDSVSGLIVACALVMPSKKIRDVRVETLEKKFKQKDFARNCSRDRILFCEKIGIPLHEFLQISLNSLKEISNELEL